LATVAKAGAGKGKKGTAVRGTRGWDAAMDRAKAQAERYVRALPPSEGNPPFVIVVDVRLSERPAAFLVNLWRH
jgi:hypothetical protein